MLKQILRLNVVEEVEAEVEILKEKIEITQEDFKIPLLDKTKIEIENKKTKFHHLEEL